MNWTPLIITVTCDPQIQDPLNPRLEELLSVDAIAQEYIDANAAGAVMDHVHGIYSADPVVQADGKQLQIPDKEATAEIIDKIRAARPDIALSTDIIVGFPGETEAEFEETLQLVNTVGFAHAFSFKFSPRPGTPAAMLANAARTWASSFRE